MVLRLECILEWWVLMGEKKLKKCFLVQLHSIDFLLLNIEVDNNFTLEGYLACWMIKYSFLLATAERYFFAMNFMKNIVQNRMENEWLNDCLVTYIEKNNFNSIDNEKIMKLSQIMKMCRK